MVSLELMDVKLAQIAMLQAAQAVLGMIFQIRETLSTVTEEVVEPLWETNSVSAAE